MLLLSLVSLIVFLISFTIFINKIKAREIIIHPFFWFSLSFFFECPIRGLILGLKIDEIYFKTDEKYFYISIIYGTIFYFLTSFFCILFNNSNMHLFKPIRLFKRIDINERRGSVIGLILVPMICWAYIYGINTKSFNLIDANVDRITEFSIAKMIAMNLSSLVYYIFGIVLIFDSKSRKRRNVFLLIFIILMLILRGVFSGARGFILIGFYLLIIYVWRIYGIKKAIKYGIIVSIPILIIIGVITHLRFGGENVYFVDNIPNKTYLVGAVSKNLSVKIIFEYFDNMIFRVTYYLDSWAYLFNLWDDGSLNNKGVYCLGSLYDLRQFVPKIIWKNKDPQDFNYWIGNYLFNSGYMKLNFPIGRIGESIFILGPYGLIFALINSFFITFFYRKFFLSDINLLKILFVAFNIGWSIQGQATLFWNLVNPIKNAIYFIFIYLIFFSIEKMLKK